MRSALILTGLLVLGLAPAIPAISAGLAPEELVIRSWGTSAGLPQNTVTAITQTRDGYLWLGTRDGLARFDGMRFTTFGLQEGLQSVDISTLLTDRQGVLWIGTLGGGLGRLADGKIVSALPGEGTEVITCLAEDSSGRLWVGSFAGLRIVEGGRVLPVEELSELTHVAIRTILPDRAGGMWIATINMGVLHFQNGRLEKLKDPEGFERFAAYCLLLDAQERLWAAIGNGQVLCLADGKWRVYRQQDGLPFAYVTSMVQSRDGTIWAGSLDDGLYFLDGERFQALRKKDGLSAEDIRALSNDSEGNLWVGTRTGGLNRLTRRKVLHYGAAQGLTNDFTRSVGESADSTIYVGTVGGGLYSGGLRGFLPFGGDNPLIRFYASVETVLPASDGSVWWGGARGLLHWRDGGQIDAYTNQPWVRLAVISALCEDRSGAIWIGTSDGRVLCRTADGFSDPLRAGRGGITALAQGPEGDLWVGSAAGGLARLKGKSLLAINNGLPSQSVRTVYVDKAGVVWIGTAGGGLTRWLNGTMVSFGAHEGLGANTVSQIVEDDFECLWLGCNQGIFRVRKAELADFATGKTRFLHPRAFGLNDGMPAEECSGGFCPAGLKTRSGLICFSTVKGLVFIDPDTQDTDAPPPNVLLEEVMIDRKPVVPQKSGADREGLPRIVVGPGAREFELHYTGINFNAPEKVSFQYQMEGMDGGWVEAGGRRTAYYHRLPPGDYTFRAKACNADGAWSEDAGLLLVTAKPYVWQTTPFLLGAGLGGVAALAGSLRILERRRYRRRLAAVQTQHAIEKERLRISQDMHDHIGGMLTQVSQLSDMGLSQSAVGGARNHFERIGAQAREAVRALDEIIWATNPKNDNLPSFAEYVSRFADEFFETTNIRCWQEVPTDLPRLPLHADLRHNVFLAFREALNNTLKHSGASEVWLRVRLERDEVRLEVQDNGRGFDAEHPRAGGNGLGNMAARLKECGGRAGIESSAGKGTHVRFCFPLRSAG